MSLQTVGMRPYYDDFSADKQFYKVLFRPGKGVQARELNTLQTILQSQISRIGDHLFTDGSMVVPGRNSIDLKVSYIKLVSTFNGTRIVPSSVVGKTLIGRTSGCKFFVNAVYEETGTNPPTIIGKVVANGGLNFDVTTIAQGESLYIEGDVNNWAQVQPSAGYTGGSSIAHIEKGVFYKNGYFCQVNDQTVIIDPYSNTPSAKIGLSVITSYVTENDDTSLFDPATGSSNYMSPGAHRYKIDLKLVAVSRTAESTDHFIDLIRILNGVVESQVDRSAYNEVMKVLARRTYEESGNYVIQEYTYDIKEHLQTDTNGGVFTPAQGGNESKFVFRLHPGSAMINGYEVYNGGYTHLELNKARDVRQSGQTTVTANDGSYFLIGDMSGMPLVNERPLIELWDTTTPDTGALIGYATAVGLGYHSGQMSNKADALYKLFVSDVHLIPSGKLKDIAVASNGSGYLYGNPTRAQARLRVDTGTSYAWLSGTLPALPAGTQIFTKSGLYLGTTAFVTGGVATTMSGYTAQNTTGAGITIAAANGATAITFAGATPAMAAGTIIHVAGVYVGHLAASVLANATTGTLTKPTTQAFGASVYTYQSPWGSASGAGVTVSSTANSRALVFAGATPAMPAGTTISHAGTGQALGVLSAAVLANATAGTLVEPCMITGSASTYTYWFGEQPVWFTANLDPAIANMWGEEFVYVSPQVVTVAGDGIGAAGIAYVNSSGRVYGCLVTAPGAGYITATASVGTPWTATTLLTTNKQVASGGNLYTCTNGGVTGATPPTHTSGAVSNGTAVLTYSGVQATAQPVIYKYNIEDIGSIRQKNYQAGTDIAKGSVVVRYGISSSKGKMTAGDLVYGGTDNKAIIYRVEADSIYTKRSGNTPWDEIPTPQNFLSVLSPKTATGTILTPLIDGTSTVIMGSGLPTIPGSFIYYNDIYVGTVNAIPAPTSSQVTLTSGAKVDVPLGVTLTWCSASALASAQANARTVFSDSNKKLQITKIPSTYVKTLKELGTNNKTINVSVARIYNAVQLDANGAATLSCAASESFEWYSNDTYFVYQVSTGKYLETNGFIKPTIFPNQVSLNFGLGYANEVVNVFAAVKKIATNERAKVLTQGSYNYVAGAYPMDKNRIFLGKTDGYKLIAVYDSLDLNVNASAATSKDITSRFNFNGGQQDGYCSQAWIAMKPNQPAPVGRLLVVFQYFDCAASSGDIFTIDSYAGITYDQVPAYRAEDGDGMFMSDSIDYRMIADGKYEEYLVSVTSGSALVTITDSVMTTAFLAVGDKIVVGGMGYCTITAINSLTTFTTNVASSYTKNNILALCGVSQRLGQLSVTGFPIVGDAIRPGSEISFKFQNYMSRIDTVLAQSDGKITVLTGIPATHPTPPTLAETPDKIKLYDIVIPAYTLNLGEVMVKRYDYKGYTMRDIANIERRLDTIEQYTVLNLLEKKVQDMQITDSVTGLSRMKLGFSVDNFKSYAGSDVSDPQYMISIEPDKGYGQTIYSQNNLEMVFDEGASTINAKNDNWLMLPWAEKLMAEQPYITTSRNVNPFAVFVWAGSVALYPNIDIWTDVDRLPDININLAGQIPGR